MGRLTSNNRFWVLCGGFVISLFVFGYVQQFVPGTQLQSIRLEQIYGFSSLLFLYLALLVSPLYATFTKLPFKEPVKHSRRAFGVLTFYFALLHMYIALFKQLGGIKGLRFLDGKYMWSLVLAMIATVILLALTLTSIDWAVRKMGFKNWKLLHRLVYIAGVLILIHVILIGTHFIGGSLIVARIVFASLLVLFFLEAWRADSYIKDHFKR